MNFEQGHSRESLLQGIARELIDEILAKAFSFSSQKELLRMEIESKPGDLTSETSESISELDFPLEPNTAIESEDEMASNNPVAKFRTKHEMDQKPSVDIDETTEQRYQRLGFEPDNCNSAKPIGKITSLFQDTVVVRSEPDIVLDLDNLVFTQNKIVLGKIDDVFGSIKNPYYSLTFDLYLKKMEQAGELKIGDEVFTLTEKAKILPQAQIEILKKKKGCDASNKYDEEVLEKNEMEFSDDEQEEVFKQKAKKKKKNKNKLETEEGNPHPGNGKGHKMKNKYESRREYREEKNMRYQNNMQNSSFASGFDGMSNQQQQPLFNSMGSMNPLGFAAQNTPQIQGFNPYQQSFVQFPNNGGFNQQSFPTQGFLPQPQVYPMFNQQMMQQQMQQMQQMQQQQQQQNNQFMMNLGFNNYTNSNMPLFQKEVRKNNPYP